MRQPLTMRTCGRRSQGYPADQEVAMAPPADQEVAMAPPADQEVAMAADKWVGCTEVN